MRPRTELVFGSALLLVLSVGAGLLGVRRAGLTDTDPRRSTLLAGPSGAGGFTDALRRLGVRVDRWRRPVASLAQEPSARRGVVALLGPSAALTAREGAALARLHADLLLAGSGAAAAARCVGWDIAPERGDSLALERPASIPAEPLPHVRATLRRRDPAEAVDSAGSEDGPIVRCVAPPARTVDTVLRTVAGAPVVVRLGLDEGRTITLVSDDRLFANRALRQSAAGPLVLGLVVPRYRRVLVDEYHHGFDSSRSLSGATLGWALHSPWGWAVLQIAGVGLVALLAAGVRFGPVLTVIDRRRRSPLEQVRALATALAAARGHDVAVRLVVQGLQRRLSRSGRGARGETAVWLDGLATAVRTPAGAAALESLSALTRRAASAEDVRLAADAVDTLWKELTPA